MRIRLFLGVLGLVVATAATAQEPAAVPGTEAAAPAAPAAAEPAMSVAAPPVAAGPAQPGDPAAGEAKAAVCGACHGIDGNALDPQYPKLAGQHERYIARQLALFKTGARENPIMLGFSAALSEQDMRDLGAFYASKAVAPGVADEKLYPRGEQIYRGGDRASGTPACMACHGPAGSGNPGARYPALAGQHANYTRAQLQKFRDGMVWGRDNDANVVMSGAAAYLSDEDIEALSTYLEGLHFATPATAATAP
ncbi:MAG TPA: c-type cytochrome [Pseudomonadota bacterium]|nr:c-type cytochrome [Pseudomonadota bacterium]HRA38807.1 c-type cytochrome [Pseudomonadota bacterium]